MLTLAGSFVFVTLLPVQGYMVAVLRSAARDKRRPPVFDDWERLTIDGIKLIAVQLAYVVVPVVVLFVGLVVAGFGAFSGTAGGSTIELLGVGVLLLGGLLLVVAAYLAPAAAANFAYREDLRAAFDLGTVTDAALTTDYLVAVVLAVVVGTVAGTVAGLLSVVIVGIFLTFYVQVSVYYLIGRGYANALGLESRPDDRRSQDRDRERRRERDRERDRPSGRGTE